MDIVVVVISIIEISVVDKDLRCDSLGFDQGLFIPLYCLAGSWCD